MKKVFALIVSAFIGSIGGIILYQGQTMPKPNIDSLIAYTFLLSYSILIGWLLQK